MKARFVHIRLTTVLAKVLSLVGILTMYKNINRAIMSMLVSVSLGLGFLLIMRLEMHSTPNILDSASDIRTYESSRTIAVVPITASSVFTYYFPTVFNSYAPPIWTFLGPPGLPIKQLAISDQNPETIYVVVDTTQVSMTTTLYKSTDNGLSWEPSADGIPGRVQSLFVHPTTPTMLLVGSLTGGTGVYRSDNGGLSWNPAGLDPFIRVVAAHPTSPTVWLAASYNPLVFGFAYAYHTENSGKNWQTVIPTTTVLDSFAFDLDNLNRVYACSWSGFLTSQDAGLTWTYGDPDSCGELLTHPYSHTIMYAVSGNRILETDDKGLNWTQLLSGEHSVHSLALDPMNPTAMYAADSGTLFRSTNAGNSWQQVPLPPTSAFSYIQDLAVSHSGRLYVGTDRGVWSISFR